MRRISQVRAKQCNDGRPANLASDSDKPGTFKPTQRAILGIAIETKPQP